MLKIDQFNSRIFNKNFKYSNSEGINLTNINLWNKNTFLENNALEKIHNWRGLHRDTNIAFIEAVNCFDKMIDNCKSSSLIETTCEYLISEINKVRNPLQLKQSLKRKSIANNIAINKIQKINKQNSVSDQLPSVSNDLKKQEYYSRFIDETNNIIEIDRIIENYNKISKRFNLDNIFKEYILSNRDIRSVIYECTELISTYNLPFKNIYECTLETLWYILNKKSIYLENSFIIDTVTDYFIFSEENLSKDNISDIKDIVYMTPVYINEDFKPLVYLDDNSETVNIKDDDNYNKENNKFIVLKDKYYNKEKKVNHKEPFSYIVSGIPNNPIGGIPNYKDYGVGGKEAEKKHYPLYSKLHEDFTDYINKKQSNESDIILNMKHELLHSITLDNKLKILFNYISKYIGIEDKNIENRLSYMLSILKCLFINNNITDDQFNKILEILDLINQNIALHHINLRNKEPILSTLQSQISYIDFNINKFKKSNSNMYLMNNLIIFKNKINNMIKSIKMLYEIILNNNTNIYSITDSISSKQIIIINELLHNLINIKNIILDNMCDLSDNILLQLSKFINVYPDIISKDIYKNKLINYRNFLRQSANKYYMRIDILNECIDNITSIRYFNSYNNINDVIKYLLFLSEIKDIILNKENKTYLNFTIDSSLYLTDSNHINPTESMEKIYNNIYNISLSNEIQNYAKKDILKVFESIINFIPENNEEIWATNIIVSVIKLFYYYIKNNKLNTIPISQYIDSIDRHIKLLDFVDTPSYIDVDSYLKSMNKIKTELRILSYKLTYRGDNLLC